MKCLECGGEYIKKSGHLDLDDKYIGSYVVYGVTYFECRTCHSLLFPSKTVDIIEVERNNKQDDLIKEYPLKDFYTASETANVLGISRQALHKHRRIRRGFIYQTKFGGKTVYLKESVELYNKNNDGRFFLKKSKKPKQIELNIDILENTNYSFQLTQRITQQFKEFVKYLSASYLEPIEIDTRQCENVNYLSNELTEEGVIYYEEER